MLTSVAQVGLEPFPAPAPIPPPVTEERKKEILSGEPSVLGVIVIVP